MAIEAFSNGLLEWIVRLAGLFWLAGAFMLIRQIRAEMILDNMTARIEAAARELDSQPYVPPEDSGFADINAPVEKPPKDPARQAIDRWIDRDDTARRGWIAAQAVVLAATALAMLMLHAFAAWLTALLVLGQGAYFFWREHTARRAPSAEAAAHARPSRATVNAGWVSLAVALLVWLAALRGLLR